MKSNHKLILQMKRSSLLEKVHLLSSVQMLTTIITKKQRGQDQSYINQQLPNKLLFLPAEVQPLFSCKENMS